MFNLYLVDHQHLVVPTPVFTKNQNDKMFSNCIDCVSHQKKKEEIYLNKKQINTGNNSAYHEPLSKVCIERRS